MNFRKTYVFTSIIGVFLLLASCSSNSTKADEPEIATMDSVSTELANTNNELDERTKKLEASLEEAEKLETAK